MSVDHMDVFSGEGWLRVPYLCASCGWSSSILVFSSILFSGAQLLINNLMLETRLLILDLKGWTFATYEEGRSIIHHRIG